MDHALLLDIEKFQSIPDTNRIMTTEEKAILADIYRQLRLPVKDDDHD